jgi:hypothetical protein
MPGSLRAQNENAYAEPGNAHLLGCLEIVHSKMGGCEKKFPPGRRNSSGFLKAPRANAARIEADCGNLWKLPPREWRSAYHFFTIEKRRTDAIRRASGRSLLERLGIAVRYSRGLE